MGIFSAEKTEQKKTAVKKEPRVKIAKKTSNFSNKAVKKEFSEAYRILCRPLVTEKSFNLNANQNQYLFEVAPEATKKEVEKTIQNLYGVKVLRVNILNTQGKKRRRGRYEGFKAGFKKAIVFLAEGEKIEIISR
jgi:large subunit ribosomal protein L23